jgi:hypothetical protein
MPTVAQVQNEERERRDSILDALLKRWFGHTGHPRLAGAALGALCLLVIALGAVGLSTFLGRGQYQSGSVATNAGNASSENTRQILNGSSAVSSDAGISTANTAKPSVSPSNLLLPSSPSSDLKKPTPKFNSTPAEPAASAALVAGRWSGTFTDCADSRVTQASMQLNEAKGTHDSVLAVSGIMVVAAAQGIQRCNLSGTYMKDKNRLVLKTSCTATAPEFLSSSHASLLTLGGGQLNGTIVPNTPCVAASFRRNQ